jgi:transcription factor CP2-like protein
MTGNYQLMHSQFHSYDQRAAHHYPIKQEMSGMPPQAHQHELLGHPQVGSYPATNHMSHHHQAPQPSQLPPHISMPSSQSEYVALQPRFMTPQSYPTSHLESPPSHNPPASIVHSQTAGNDAPYSIHPISNSPTPIAPPHAPVSSNLRYEIVLEAQTAAAQRIDESSLTYLNKAQHYAISLNDHDKYDGDITSTIKIMFHDENHRRMAGTYWSFWLGQQPVPKSAKAIVLDKAASTGIKNVDAKTFDRVTFEWNGRKGAKIYVKFNCLSTDFSRIKGVKGIPMRINMASKDPSYPDRAEKCFCKVKLFRDKGAERKNKDDQRHLEKVWDKMKGKTTDTSPLLMMFAPVSNVTHFTECPAAGEIGDNEEEFNMPLSDDIDPQAEVDQLVQSGKIQSRKFDALAGDFPDLVDVDPTYVPHLRKRKRVLCLYMKLANESVYRALYLEKLEISDLLVKLAEKLQVPTNSIGTLTRVNKKGNVVELDDTTIANLEDEQDILVECEVPQDPSSGMLNVTLRF